MYRIVMAAMLLIPPVSAPCSAPLCRCHPIMPSVEQARNSAAAVFLGQALASPDTAARFTIPKLAAFEVLASWKGLASDTLVIHTDAASCSLRFEQGESYVVYAHERDGKLLTHLCTRTRHVDEATADLDSLGTPGRQIGYRMRAGDGHLAQPLPKRSR